MTTGTFAGMRRISAAWVGCAVLQALFCVAADVALAGDDQSDHHSGEWRNFGGSKHFDRYSPLSQINRDTVSRLGVAWTRPGVDASFTQKFPDINPSNYMHGTPIMIDGVLYAPNAVSLVEAFDPATGKTLWVQQAATLREAAGQSTRGLDFWRNGADKRIVALHGEYLMELDADTGKPRSDFGDHGRVSLNRHTPDNEPFFGYNGPLVVGDVIVMGGNGGGKAGSGFGDSGTEIASRPEDIRGYDVRTGRQLWTFHVMPQPGDPARNTWGKGSADFVGNMGAWAPLSADEQLGYVYVPLSAPTESTYGGHRPGDNLYSDCLVALNAKTGKLVWYFQTVHHDLWDYDNASAPTLGDITVDGKRIQAVMQPNKNGFLFVFDRVTGKPVWPIVERPVPQSTVPGEASSPTQPFPTKPPAFDRQGITADDVIDFTPELKREALKILASHTIGPLFTPPSLPTGGKKGSIVVASGWGSGNWNTGAFDPERGVYYAVSGTHPDVYALKKPTEPGAAIAYEEAEDDTPSSMYGIGPRGLPLLKPPYGRITALDLNSGEKLWMVANGDGPRDHPLLKDLHLPPLGTIGRSAPLLTRSLLFAGESSDAAWSGVPGPAKFRAYDKANGAVLWETTLPAGTTGGPITYEAGGKQYIVVPIGGKDYGTGWVALALDATGTIPVPATGGTTSSGTPSPAGSAARAEAVEPSGSAATQDHSSAGELAQTGKFLYQARCARCHGTELEGPTPLRGDEFRQHWDGKTARNVYSRIISTMPLDDAGILSEPEALRIAIHVLTVNGVHFGQRPIEGAAALNDIKLEWGTKRR